ncbi:MAG: hypothetical protein R6W77_16380, partial [Trueperaceae bacterium]
MTSRLGASLADTERRLRNYKRLIYALLLAFAAIDVAVSLLFVTGELQTWARVVTAGALVLATLVVWLRKDALRLVEVAVFGVGSL